MRSKNSCISTINKLISTLLVRSDCSLENPSSLLFNSAPFCAAAIIFLTRANACSSAVIWRSRNCKLPNITVNKLLKSCATPPVSRPIASIFWDWMSIDSISFCLEMSVKLTTAPITRPRSSIGSAEYRTARNRLCLVRKRLSTSTAAVPST